MQRTATLSSCQQYRYALGRRWDKKLPVLGWVMLNPSTADAETDDATIRVCIGRAKRMGFGGIRVVNLFNYRSTKPEILKTVENPVGPGADIALITALSRCGMTIAAWGAHGSLKGYQCPRCEEVLEILCLEHAIKLHALKLTKSGQPCHPLRISYDVQPFLWMDRVKYLKGLGR